MERPPLLTVKQAAEYLSLPATTVYDLVQKKKLPHFRMGVQRGTIRLDPRDLDAYMKAGRVEPEQPLPTLAKARRFQKTLTRLVHLKPPEAFANGSQN